VPENYLLKEQIVENDAAAFTRINTSHQIAFFLKNPCVVRVMHKEKEFFP
jgi:hypothetical protein